MRGASCEVGKVRGKVRVNSARCWVKREEASARYDARNGCAETDRRREAAAKLGKNIKK